MSDVNGALPEGWAKVTLADVTSHSKEKSEPSDFGDAKYIGLEHIEGGSNRIIGFGDVSTVKSTKAVFRSGDVLYGKLRPYLKKVCRPNFDGICSTDILVFPQIDDLDNGYLLHFLSQQSTSEFATQNANGINLPRISPKTLGEINFPTPPLVEQRRIVAKIESLQERSSRARRALSEVGPLLEQFRQSVLRAAFSGRLTADWRAANPNVEPAKELLSRIRTERRNRWEQSELAKYEAKSKQPPKNWQDKYKEPEAINPSEVANLRALPDGWCWASADELTAIERPIIYGIIKPGPDTPGGVPYVRITEMKGRRVHVNDLRRCNPKREEKFKRARLNSGDILISKDGATYGMVAIVPDEAEGANITQHVLRYSVFSEVNNEYIAYVIESPTCQRWIDGQIKGMAMPGINVGDFRRMPIPVPPHDEQPEIRDRIEEFLGSTNTVETALNESESALTQMDQSILAKAFRGELVPQDPRDEPASELLARIREQREAQAAAKKSGKKTGRRTKKKDGTKNEQPSHDAPLLNALAEAEGPLHVDDLRAASGLTSKEFYSRLKDAIARGIIKEKVEDNERYLVPGK